MACSSKQTVKVEYIKQEIPPLPEPPQYYGVKFVKEKDRYCVSHEEAKNLLKNRELDKAYMEELRIILESLKGKHGRDF
jgi:hypothetical protein